jgi:hypothetical protein
MPIVLGGSCAAYTTLLFRQGSPEAWPTLAVILAVAALLVTVAVFRRLRLADRIGSVPTLVAPELKLLSDPPLRDEVWRRAAMATRATAWPAMVIVFLAVAFLTWALAPRGWASSILGFAAPAITGATVVLYRRSIRRAVRSRLRFEGLHLCLRCGHPASPRTSRVCAECGSSIPPPMGSA